MAEVLWALEAVATGCLLAHRFGRYPDLRPRWARILLMLGCGAAGGMGITSCLFFVCRLLFPSLPRMAMFLETALAAWLIFDARRRRQKAQAEAEPGSGASLWNRALAVALIAAVLTGTVGIASSWEANPQGEWDAWAIWNLRARYLAAPGDLSQRAWSAGLTDTHPEYPLLLSGFIARCWVFAGSTTTTAPNAASYLFFLALMALATGGVAAWRGESLGLLCGLVLAGTPYILFQVPWLYSDIALACYFAGALVMLLLDRPAAAGLFASLAVWTKDEGWLFLLVFFAAVAVLRRPRLRLAMACAAPVTVLALYFKLVLARGLPSLASQASSGFLSKLVDVDRYAKVVSACAAELGKMMLFGWYHPLWPLIVLAVGLRFSRERRHDAFLAGSATAAMMAGYFFVYITTPFDLDWHLGSSLNRLVMQLWPCLVLTLFAVLRSPEGFTVEPRPEGSVAAGPEIAPPPVPSKPTAGRGKPRRKRG